MRRSSDECAPGWRETVIADLATETERERLAAIRCPAPRRASKLLFYDFGTLYVLARERFGEYDSFVKLLMFRLHSSDGERIK